MWYHDFTGMILGVAFWVMVGAIIIVPRIIRSRDQARMHETLRMAYEKGQPVPPELIAALQTNTTVTVQTTPERDLRRAIVLIAVGLGLCCLGYGLFYGLSSVDDTAAYITGGSVAGAAAIPGMIGIAYLILWLSKRNAPKA